MNKQSENIVKTGQDRNSLFWKLLEIAEEKTKKIFGNDCFEMVNYKLELTLEVPKYAISLIESDKSELKKFVEKRYREANHLQIKERDGYKCCLCGRDNLIVAHHIFPKSIGILVESWDSLITLCNKCHGKTMNKDYYNDVEEYLKGLTNGK